MKMPSKSLRRRLLDAIEHQLRSNASHWPIVLAEPPFHLPPGTALHHHEGKPLRGKDAQGTFPAHGVVRYWPDIKVHASRYPYLGLVLTGRIHWRIGITEQAARKFKGPLLQSDYAALELAAGTFFLMPPEVPYASGEWLHWSPASDVAANYHVLWLRFLPSGVECHFCWTEPGGQVSEADYFVSDPHLYALITTLIDELRTRGQADLTASQALLKAILHRLTYALQELQEKRRGLILEESETRQSPDAAVELACRYIEAHSHEKLTLGEIATHSFVSVGHLSRIFREQKGLSLNQYITGHRLERACALLRGSSLSISAVGKSVGYPDSAYFSRLFARTFGSPPLEFRQRHLREYYKKSSDVTKSQE